MKHKWLIPLIILIIPVALIGVIGVAALEGYTLDWWSVDGGGAGSGADSSTGGPYSLGGTIGQPDAGSSFGGDYTLDSGFWGAGMNTPGDQTLNVNVNGSGGVTSVPPGIDCGPTCVHAFAFNTSVELTAAASPGWTFTGWSDGPCSGTGTCTVVMSEARSVMANFTHDLFRIHLPIVIK